MQRNETKSLIFVIEDIAKLLRLEVKKNEPLQKKRTTTNPKSATPNFVNAVEQIAKMLRMQAKRLSLKQGQRKSTI